MSQNTNIGDLVLYKNNQLIDYNKPSGVPVQHDSNENKPLISLAEIYCKATLYLIHRLDQPASGVILFAKNKRALANVNAQFQGRQVKKTYLAVVKNKPETSEGNLVHFLKKDGQKNLSRAFDTEEKGSKRAELSYRVIASSDHYHLLEIVLITGRHHQIRAQLAAIGSPIRGDNKYGFKRGNPDRSIQLHAWKIAFKHPVTTEEVELTAPLPNDAIWNAFDLN